MIAPMQVVENDAWNAYGHERAVEVLRRSIRSERLGHAYLFAGPDGTGKRTLATAFAMAINCESVPASGEGSGNPCGLCPQCARIKRGAHPDVTYVDLESQALAQSGGKKQAPAKELRIETIREMQSGLTLLPHSARRKVYIIGDAERMNDEAANCLLKSLEEPPAHSTLILLASDESGVLPTISSRCIFMPLRGVRRQLVSDYLRENYGVSGERADLLAALSGGRIGSAVKLSSDAAALETRAEALRELSLVSGATVTDRLGASARLAKMFTDARAGLYNLLETWEGWWRDLLVTSVDADELILNVDHEAVIQSAGEHISPERALEAIALIQDTRRQLRENVNPRLALESLTLNLP